MKIEVHDSSDAIGQESDPSRSERPGTAAGGPAGEPGSSSQRWPCCRSERTGGAAAAGGGPAACRAAEPGPAGAPVICGGGGLPESVRGEFIRLAGGPKARIVVIPTASGDADGPADGLAGFLEPWTRRGVASTVLLHTRSRARPMNRVHPAARGGHGRLVQRGDQSRVTEAYLGTAVEWGCTRCSVRGGVIGGTSADAALMSRVMITGGRARATVGTGFGFLPGTVVDQHARSAAGSIASSASWPIIATWSAWPFTSPRRRWSTRGAGRSWATRTLRPADRRAADNRSGSTSSTTTTGGASKTGSRCPSPPGSRR